jgi:hypothetical protein
LDMIAADVLHAVGPLNARGLKTGDEATRQLSSNSRIGGQQSEDTFEREAQKPADEQEAGFIDSISVSARVSLDAKAHRSSIWG